MNNITIKIEAPELVEAFMTLANSLRPVTNFAPETVQIPQTPPVTVTAEAPPAQQTASVPTSPTAAPVQQPAPTQQFTLHNPLTNAPYDQQPAQHTAPVVPTTTQTYTMEQLAVAATQLMDAGHKDAIQSLLGSFGVQALTQLQKEQYGAFATALRGMGAKI